MPRRNAARMPLTLAEAMRRGREGTPSSLGSYVAARRPRGPASAPRGAGYASISARTSSSISSRSRASASRRSRSPIGSSGTPASRALTTTHAAPIRITWQTRLNQISRPMMTANEASSGLLDVSRRAAPTGERLEHAEREQRRAARPARAAAAGSGRRRAPGRARRARRRRARRRAARPSDASGDGRDHRVLVEAEAVEHPGQRVVLPSDRAAERISATPKTSARPRSRRRSRRKLVGGAARSAMSRTASRAGGQPAERGDTARRPGRARRSSRARCRPGARRVDRAAVAAVDEPRHRGGDDVEEPVAQVRVRARSRCRRPRTPPRAPRTPRRSPGTRGRRRGSGRGGRCSA